MSGCALVATVHDERKLHLLYVVGDENAEWRADHCSIGKPEKSCCLCLRGALVTGNDMNRSASLLFALGERGRSLVIPQTRWTNHSFARANRHGRWYGGLNAPDVP